MAAIERSTPIDGVALLTMNRPEALNAMTVDLVQGLHDHLDDIAVDRSVRVVILTGAGRGFCAGLDLTGYGKAPHTEGLGRTQSSFAVQKHIVGLIPKMRSLPQPIISAVNGAAVAPSDVPSCVVELRERSGQRVARKTAPHDPRDA